MQRLLQKVFGIYPGEGKTTLRFARFASFGAFSTLCLETLADGLFLEKVGADSLPIVYLFTAWILILISSIVIYALRRTSPYQILKKIILLGALLVGGIIFLLLSGIPPFWFWFGLKIFTRLFFSVFLACAWTFIDQYHDLQEAKRVYSLYSAAYFLGIVLSGCTINLFLKSGGYPLLFSISLVFILLAFFQAKKIVETIPAVHDDTIEGVFSGDRNSFMTLIQLLKKSPYTLSLLALSLIGQSVLIITEFNNMEIFEKIFQVAASSDSSKTASQISEFLGKARGAISLGNLIIGAFFYSPFTRRIGLNNVILITPLFFIFVYFSMLIHQSLFIGVLGLIAIDGVLFTIEDNSFNLLTKAVPAKLKSKVRIINDSFFEPLGMLICSCLLLFLGSFSTWLGIILSFSLLFVTLFLRSLYAKALFTSLKENAIHFERTVRDWLTKMTRKEAKEVKKDLLHALVFSSEEKKLLSMEALLAYQDPLLLKPILSTAESFSVKGKIAVIHLLEKSPLITYSQVLEKLNDWSQWVEEPELFQTAYFSLAKQGLLHPEKVMQDLDASNLLLRGAAILTLKKSQAPQSPEQSSLNRTIAQKEADLLLKSEAPEEVILGLHLLKDVMGSEGAEKAFSLLNHAHTGIKRAASQAIAETADKSFRIYLPKLLEGIQESSDPWIRKNGLIALGKIGDSTTVKEILLASISFRPSERRLVEQIILQMGLKTVPMLLTILKDSRLHYLCRILAAKILAQLSLPQLRAHLEEIISIEQQRAYFYFFHGNTVQKNYPEYDLSLLKDALFNRFQSVIDFIIHLLGSVGSIEDSELLVLSLHSKNEKVHSNAVETLEKACDSRIFSWLLPLIETIPIEEKMRAFYKYYQKPVSLHLEALLHELDDSPSLSDQIISAHLKATLKIPNWRETLREQMKTSEEAFHHFAYELLEK